MPIILPDTSTLVSLPSAAGSLTFGCRAPALQSGRRRAVLPGLVPERGRSGHHELRRRRRLGRRTPPVCFLPQAVNLKTTPPSAFPVALHPPFAGATLANLLCSGTVRSVPLFVVHENDEIDHQQTEQSARE